MSKKYFDKLMSGSGVTNKKVKSKFGEAMLKKMGWSEGKGLGKQEDGELDCVQIKRKEDATGLGTKEDKKKFKWDDAFWVNMYDNVAKKLNDNFVSAGSTSSEDEIEIIKVEKKVVKANSFKLADSKAISKPLTKEERRKLRKEKRKTKAESFKVTA